MSYTLARVPSLQIIPAARYTLDGLSIKKYASMCTFHTCMLNDLSVVMTHIH